MGGRGDDGVEWGKLYLGEGCCEDTEQKIVTGKRTLVEHKLENIMT